MESPLKDKLEILVSIIFHKKRYPEGRIVSSWEAYEGSCFSMGRRSLHATLRCTLWNLLCVGARTLLMSNAMYALLYIEKENHLKVRLPVRLLFWIVIYCGQGKGK